MLNAEQIALELRDVGHRYGGIAVLEEVSFALPAGSATAVIGPDGVGKSTLLGLIAGVRKLRRANCARRIDVEPDHRRRWRDASRLCLRASAGTSILHCPSSRTSISTPAFFGLARAARAARIARLVAATGLAPFPSRPAGQLSGGMKQKLSLCCALVHDPDLLILDEPTTGVDPLSRRQFWALIAEIRAERPAMTVLISTAYMEEAQSFERVIAMDLGRVLANATTGKLLTDARTDSLETAYRSLQAGPSPEPPHSASTHIRRWSSRHRRRRADAKVWELHGRR